VETLFALLWWPVAGALILFACRALLRKGVGPWWSELICLPLWALAVVVFGFVGEHLHDGRLVQILFYSQGVSAFHAALCQTLYAAWVAVCVGVSTRPADRRIAEERRKKKAAKAALAAGE
jgi:hypothetical protein